MRAMIVKGFVVQTLGLVVPVISLSLVLLLSGQVAALPPSAVGKNYCICNCSTSSTNRLLGWEKDQAFCTLSVNEGCSLVVGTKKETGTLTKCCDCTVQSNGWCSGTCGAISISGSAAPQPGAVLQPGTVLQPGRAPTPSGGLNLPGSIAHSRTR